MGESRPTRQRDARDQQIDRGLTEAKRRKGSGKGGEWGGSRVARREGEGRQDETSRGKTMPGQGREEQGREGGVRIREGVWRGGIDKGSKRECLTGSRGSTEETKQRRGEKRSGRTEVREAKGGEESGSQMGLRGGEGRVAHRGESRGREGSTQENERRGGEGKGEPDLVQVG